MLDSPSSALTPWQRRILVLCAIVWAIRFLFASLPAPLSGDELAVIECVSHAPTFMATSNWAERWGMIEHYGQGRVLWMVGHVLWAGLWQCSSNGALTFNLLLAFASIAALCGAARHLFGASGWWWCLLLVSVSPMHLIYSIRILATMPTVMWLCIALFALTKPRATWAGWAVGGLSLGLAFVTHYGAGVIIVAMVAGLAAQIVVPALRGCSPWSHVWTRRLPPALLGAIAASLPLLVTECWARYSDGVYFHRLLTHENVGATMGGAHSGPYGLFARELCELDPLLAFLGLAIFGYAAASSKIARPTRLTIVMLGLAIMTLVLIGMTGAPGRSRAVILPVGVVGIALGAWASRSATNGAASPWMNSVTTGPSEPASAYSTVSLVITLIAVLVIFTAARPLSCMARLTFTAWPILVLVIICGLTRLRMDLQRITIVTAMLLGCCSLATGAYWALRAKTVATVASVYRDQHPDTFEVNYFDLLAPGNDAYDRLKSRAAAGLAIIGPPDWLYPAGLYEEEPYKVAEVIRRLHDAGMDGLLSPTQFVYSSVFVPLDESYPLWPPVNAALIPRVNDAQHRVIGRVQRHAYRGLELRFPAGVLSSPIQISTAMDLAMPTSPTPTVLGFEVMALSHRPAGSPHVELHVRVSQQGRELARVSVPVGEWNAEQFAPVIADVSRPPVSGEVEFTAELDAPVGTYLPPVSCYIRRRYMRAADTARVLSDSRDRPIEADERLNEYPGFDKVRIDLLQICPAFEFRRPVLTMTRVQNGKSGKGIAWEARAWTTNRPGELIFAGSFEDGVQCQLSVNDRPAIEFEAYGGADRLWRDNSTGVSLFYRHLNYDLGNHGLFFLRLPPDTAAPGDRLVIRLKILDGLMPWHWFGVRWPQATASGSLSADPATPQSATTAPAGKAHE